ncbi:MAG: VWA domain-containing protein [Clostridia bacterium]|nr:VWA domain-containing protein [Clostridia bacterium]
MTNRLSSGHSLARKVLAVLMIVMLVVSAIASNIVWAEETTTTTNGYYDASGNWHRGGNGVFEYLDGDLTLSKTAKPVEGEPNIFEITLSVGVKLDAEMFNPNSIATVLVIDVSASMKACEECASSTSHYRECSKSKGVSNTAVSDSDNRLAAAKQAAIEFIDEMRNNTAEGVGRYVNLVTFSTYTDNKLDDWQDVTTDEGYNKVKTAINNLQCSTGSNGGTNLDGGIGNALELISDAKVSSISKLGKSVVILTDGKPTYYINTSGSLRGDGSTSTKTMLDDTILAADELKEIANVFTVCYNAADTTTYSGGPTVGKFLENSIATPATADTIYAYNADSALELITSFMSIVDIALEKAEVVITDPMPDNIIIPEGGMPEGVSYVDGKWSFHDVVPTEERVGDYIIYTYTIIYLVEADPYSNEMSEGGFYPANKPTQLVMDNGEAYDFPVPGIMPVASKYDVTYNSGDHGSIEGEDEDGNYTFEDIITGNPTPAAPEVTPDEGWYFVGWSPEVDKTVTDEVTYTAVYSQKKVITVTGNSSNVTYNGTEQSLAGFTVNGLPSGWSIDGIGYGVSGKNVGTYNGVFEGTAVVTDEYGNTVPAEQYVITLTPGTLTINKRDLTITANSDSKEYDGTALTNSGWTFSVLAGTDSIAEVNVAGSQTNVGESANVASGAAIMNGNEDVTANYNITYVEGTLSVTSNSSAITITADSASKTYDGTPLTDGGYTFTQGVLAQDDVLTVVIEGSQTSAGTSANKVVSYKVMRNGVDVTSYYTFAAPVDGVLTVDKREVTITADSASKVYDGTALTDGGWKDIAPAGLADGDTVASVIVSGSQTSVGESANVASGAVIMRGNEDVTASYDITYVDGTLTVNKVGAAITITANSNSKIYDGLPLYDGGYTFTQGVLAEGDVLLVTVEGSIADVGTVANKVVSYKVMRDGVDVTSYYTFAEPVDGTLTVTKRDLIITADSATKEYDGTELYDGGYEDTPVVGLASTDKIKLVSVIGSQLDVGSSTNKIISAQIVTDDEYGFPANRNYNIILVDGTLTVTKNTQVITITVGSATKEYDGTPLTKHSCTKTEGIIPEDHSFIVFIEGSQTNVGSSPNKAVSYMVKRDGVDITSYFTFAQPVDGTLTVTGKTDEITITADSATKEYDGTPLTNGGYTVNGELADGDEIVAVIEGSQTFAGTSENKVVSYKVMRDGVDVTANYTNLNTVNGTLTVTGKTDEITITADSASKEYDGTPLTNGGYTVNGELAEGDEIVVEIEGSQTNVGTSENKVVSIKVIRDGVDVTDNYLNLKLEDGTLTVNKAAGEIIVTAGSASKEYDGTPLTSGEYTVDGKLADGEEIVVVIEGSQTEVGTSANKVVSIKVMRDGVDVTDNYNIGIPVDGELTITKSTGTITVTAGSASKEYDGTPLTSDAYTVDGTLAEGDEIFVQVAGSQTFAGTSPNVVVSIKILRDGVDVTNNYKSIISVEGTLTVEKAGAPIIITAGSAIKEYDGEPLTSSDYTYEGTLIEGDELVVEIEGSQTEVGASANKVVSIKVMRGETDVTDCYNIELPVDGELVITEKNPFTGDNTNITLWNVMMMVSALVLIALVLTSRKQRAR